MNFCIMNHGGALHYYKIAEVVLKSVTSLLKLSCLDRLTAGGAPEINVNLPTERASARGRGSRVFDNYSDHLIRLSFDINPGNDHLNSFLILRDAIYLTMLTIDAAGL